MGDSVSTVSYDPNNANMYVSLMRLFTHTVLLDHEIVCQIRARVPDPAVRSVQADHNIPVDLW